MKTWKHHRQQWVESLSMPMNNAEHRVGNFLRRKECENLDWFLEAVSEMEQPLEGDAKYLLNEDLSLLQKIKNTFQP